MSLNYTTLATTLSSEKKNWRWYRAERYRLQSIIRDWLYQEGKKVGLKYPENYHKTAKCLYTRYQQNVEIRSKTEQTYQIGQAYYKGLIRCARLWTCPVCAAKIQSERRKETCKLVDWAYKSNYKCLLVTLTSPHYTNQSCQELVKKVTSSLHNFRAGKIWKYWKELIGFTGLVRGLEVNYGENGWHIHTHEIWIVAKNAEIDQYLYLFLLTKWKEAVKRNNLLLPEKEADFNVHGIDIIDNAHSTDYLAKSSWGVDAEVVTVHRKYGKSGLTPFQLVDAGKREKFLEYAQAFHGKRQLFYSPGLKKLAGIKEISDKQIVTKEEKSDILGTLTPNDWREIVAHGDRAKILEIVEDQGILGVREWISQYDFFRCSES